MLPSAVSRQPSVCLSICLQEEAFRIFKQDQTHGTSEHAPSVKRKQSGENRRAGVAQEADWRGEYPRVPPAGAAQEADWPKDGPIDWPIDGPRRAGA